MNKYRKIISITAAMLILFGALGFGGISKVRAVDQGVYTIPFEDINKFSCANLNAMEEDVFSGVTSDFGFKLANVPDGVFPFDKSNGGELTGGAPSDPYNSVEIEALDSYSFNWLASLGIDAVIVKASTAAEVYVYIPEAYEGGPLFSVPKDALSYHDISHIEFCYDYELTATKTAETSYTRTYDWTISKEANGIYTGFIGDPKFTHYYTVSVTKKVIDSDWLVSGIIMVNNRTPYSVDFTVQDIVEGVMVEDVSCGSTSLAPGASTTCTYSAGLEGAFDGTNTATITSSNPNVGSATATKAYTFGAPTTVIGPETINVSDSFEGSLGSASADKTFATYYKSFQCSGTPGDYIGGVWTMDQYVNTATIDETGQTDTAKVDLTCYAPVLDKDAYTNWEKKYDWTITKGPDGDYEGFIGDETFNHGYVVTVDQTETDQNFKVYGEIDVTNPVGSPGDMTVSLADKLDALTSATVDCGDGATSITVAPGYTESCSYEGYLAAKDDGINTATGTFNGVTFTTTEPFAFGEPTIVGEPTINVTDSFYGSLGSADGDKTFATYYKSFQCSGTPGDYINGVWTMDLYVNTATIVETKQTDTAKVDLTCYAPVLDKDAYTNWEKKYDWTITKGPDGDYEGFIGDEAFNHGYVVTVDQTVADQNFKVYGEIDVTNPVGSPGDMTVSLADKLDTLTSATVNCGDGATSITVAPGYTESCSYEGYLAAKADGTNTATGIFNGVTFTTTEPFAFGEPTIVGYPTINVTDSFYGTLGSASADTTFATYNKSFQCSGTPGDYINGVWTMDQYVNTATIVETKQTDTAKVDLTCYAPVITKDATATYDERHIWDVDKTVDPESQGGFAGDTLPWTWTVKVSETFVEETFLVTGKIYVANPAGSSEDMTVSLVDQLNDGTFATVDCGEGATSITVATEATGTCAYTAEPGGLTATLNTATGTFNSIDFVATAPVNFVKTVVNGTATVTDNEIGLIKELTAGLGPWEFNKDYIHPCSTNRADYFVDGVYTQGEWSITNWAYVYSDDVEQDKDDATTTYTCDASFVDVLKTTNGVVDPTKDIRFKLYDGDGVYLDDEVSTSGDEDGQLQFQTALVPGASYTICEAPVPAGYTFEITVDGGNVLTYAGPPGESNPTGEIQCFDFTAPENSTTILFNINNRYPGGAPRTPGYWKNWSTCSGGNQQYTAEALGGVAEGVYLLDDLLQQTLGDFDVDTCEVGVSILNARDVVTGKNRANDAGYTLARALLAARLNQDAGACVPTAEMLELWTTMSLEEVLTAADTLLIEHDYAGTGDVLSNKDKKVKDDYNYALSLAGIIDAYNNGLICSGEPSH